MGTRNWVRSREPGYCQELSTTPPAPLTSTTLTPALLDTTSLSTTGSHQHFNSKQNIADIEQSVSRFKFGMRETVSAVHNNRLVVILNRVELEISSLCYLILL